MVNNAIEFVSCFYGCFAKVLNLKIMTRNELGKWLKAVRENRNLTKPDINEKGLRYEVIKAIEEGSTNYTVDNLLKYLKAIKKVN